MTVAAQQRIRKIKVESLITSKFFKQGLADYASGKWTEFCGESWYRFDAGVLYERGRQYAAANGPRPVTPSAYMKLRNDNSIR